MKQPDYERYARFYDYFELAGFDESAELNAFLDELFSINSVKTVIDFACGTGAQSIGLARKGYKVLAADINPAMIKIARQKAKRHGNLPISFRTADMVKARHGKADAAICIFNAIGHLNTQECKEFFCNAHNHLNDAGLFVADIFNLKALQSGAFEEYRYLSRELVIDSQIINHVRNCELDAKEGVVKVKSLTRCQNGSHNPVMIEDEWEMKVYEPEELRSMLEEAGFNEIMFFGPTGTEFEPHISDSILAVCQS
ncbi:MAG: class I SAM-dependent methyltransferase [Candidatus Rifleibacteriota bacterium]